MVKSVGNFGLPKNLTEPHIHVKVLQFFFFQKKLYYGKVLRANVCACVRARVYINININMYTFMTSLCDQQNAY
jgi:hypothetical protein